MWRFWSYMNMRFEFIINFVFFSKSMHSILHMSKELHSFCVKCLSQDDSKPSIQLPVSSSKREAKLQAKDASLLERKGLESSPAKISEEVWVSTPFVLSLTLWTGFYLSTLLGYLPLTKVSLWGFLRVWMIIDAWSWFLFQCITKWRSILSIQNC